jgi:hypothetical protein
MDKKKNAKEPAATGNGIFSSLLPMKGEAGTE